MNLTPASTAASMMGICDRVCGAPTAKTTASVPLKADTRSECDV